MKNLRFFIPAVCDAGAQTLGQHACGMLHIMYHFYTEKSNISEDTIIITGEDVNHIKNVLRMKEGEEIIICDSEGTDYHTRIKSLDRDEVIAEILSSGISEAEMPFRSPGISTYWNERGTWADPDVISVDVFDLNWTLSTLTNELIAYGVK